MTKDQNHTEQAVSDKDAREIMRQAYDAAKAKFPETVNDVDFWPELTRQVLTFSAQVRGKAQEPVRWLVEWTERFGEQQSLIFATANNAEGFVKFNGSGTVTPLYAAAPQVAQEEGQTCDHGKRSQDGCGVCGFASQQPDAQQSGKDAERYRWLRDRMYVRDKRYFHICLPCGISRITEEMKATSDETIDAAIAKEQGR